MSLVKLSSFDNFFLRKKIQKCWESNPGQLGLKASMLTTVLCCSTPPSQLCFSLSSQPLFIRQKIFRGFEKYFSLITFETGFRGWRPTCTWMQNWLQNIHLIKEVRRVGWLVERKGKSERPTSKHLSKWLSRKTIRNCFSLEEAWLVTWQTVMNCDVLWREVTRLITILQFKNQIKIWLSQFLIVSPKRQS